MMKTTVSAPKATMRSVFTCAPSAPCPRAHLPRSAEEAYRMPMATESATWTVAQRDRLPDDGKKYEVVGGELFVTPAPAIRHELIVRELGALLLHVRAESSSA